MPIIGRLGPERAARAFADYLATQGVRIELRPEGDHCLIVLADERQEARVREELERFLTEPDAPRYHAASWQTGAMLKQAASPGLDLGGLLSRAGMVTKVLTALSILLTLLTHFGHDEVLLRYFLISNYDQGLLEIRNGQWYRLITPIFLHFMVIHLLFNMMWFWDFGGQIERRLSGRWLLVIVLLTGISSNLAQYLAAGPYFGGMSGVVYGLLGFCWLKGLTDPASGLAIRPQIVAVMVGWLVLCFTGLLGPVANIAHLVGLVSGAVAGYLAPRALTGD